jgi:hypothetical protein
LNKLKTATFVRVGDERKKKIKKRGEKKGRIEVGYFAALSLDEENVDSP